ncbi:DUF3772 domain-containing protein [Reyranella sp.]|uniref:DUF3772 domain-containing protein n=1 Tax=Reyranella sp. TaxID=1929291 RepID=UPI003BAA3187
MRFFLRLAWLLLAPVLLVPAIALPALAQPAGSPQRPFAQLVELWTRQLDRIATRTEQAGLLPVEIDSLREQAADVRTAASAAASLARSDLADTRKLLAPLEVKPGTEAAPEPAEVKADRERLLEQAAVSEGRLKQCEVIIARADQLIERLTRLRSQLLLDTLLHRNVSPLSADAWRNLPGQLSTSLQAMATAFGSWGRDGLGTLRLDHRDLVSLAAWAALTVALWLLGRYLRRRFGRGTTVDTTRRARIVAVTVDGVGLVLVPILAVWLITRLLAATAPPPLVDTLLTALAVRAIAFLLVVGLTATALAPQQRTWRVLPFTDDAAQALSTALRRLMAIGLGVDFLYVALVRGAGPDAEALASIAALIVAIVVSLLALPTLGNRAWQAERPEGVETSVMIGGTWWSVARVVLSIAVLSSIVFALLGYVTLASHLHNAIYATCILIAVALLLHRLVGDVLEEAAAPDTPTGRWVRHRFGLPPDKPLRGQHIVMLLVDLVLLVLLGVAIPAAWGVDIDAIADGAGQLLRGVRIGGVTISLGNIAIAILAFIVCMALARVARAVVRDSVLPTIDAPLPLRQSIDAGLNYAGVIIALLVGVSALGIDFTNLAIVLGALSVGIGLGLQNIANNVISGVILLVERPIKAGDWVIVDGHEGFVRRISIRATEIETFQRASVIVPNSMFLQSAVINRTYADTSSRVEISVTVGYGSDVAQVESILRESALGQPLVLRVPAPIVRFVRMGSDGLEFDLFAFVARVEDRLVVGNGLNRTILEKLREAEIEIPFRTVDLHLRDADRLVDAIRGPTAGTSAETSASAPAAPGSMTATGKGPGDTSDAATPS